MIIEFKKVKLRLGFKEKMSEDAALEFNMTKVFEKALSSYLMKNYEGEVLLFYAKENYYYQHDQAQIKYKRITISDEEKNSWKKYAEYTTIYDIEGEHLTIFDFKHAKEFAAILQKHLDNASAISMILINSTIRKNSGDGDELKLDYNKYKL